MLDPRHQEGFDFLILSLCSVSDRAGGPREASGRKQDAAAQCGASLGRAIKLFIAQCSLSCATRSLFLCSRAIFNSSSERLPLVSIPRRFSSILASETS